MFEEDKSKSKEYQGNKLYQNDIENKYSEDENYRDNSYETSVIDRDFIEIDSGNSEEEINPNINYIFLFGTAQSGKSVITATTLYYLNTQEGTLRPNKQLGNDYDARVLKSIFFDNLKKGILPERTAREKVVSTWYQKGTKRG